MSSVEHGLSHRWRTRAILTAAIAASTIAAVPVSAQCTRGAGPERVRIIVSATLAEVSFPCDSTAPWGRSRPRDIAPLRGYNWMVVVNPVVAGSGIFGLDAWEPDPESDRVPTLESLVRRGATGTFLSGMAQTPGVPIPRLAQVRDGRIVLTLRDSAMIHDLFGMRPAFARAFWSDPRVGAMQRQRGALRTADDSVRIEYVAPELPMPDSAVRERARWNAESERRRVEWEMRGIRVRDEYLGERSIWLEAGDTISVRFYREICHHDACGSELNPVHGPWSVADGAVATMEVRQDTGTVGRYRIPGVRRTILRGIAPGTTTLAVRVGEDSVVKRVVVAPALRSFELDASDTIVTRVDSLSVGLRINDTGRVLPPHATIRLSLRSLHTSEYGSRAEYDSLSGRVRLTFVRSGEHLLTSALGRHADSLRVLVIPRGVRPLPSWEPRTLSGFVVRASDGRPVAGASVVAAGRTVTTDSTGAFALHVMPRETTRVTVEAEGFSARELRVRVHARDGTRLEIPLSARAPRTRG